MDELLLRFPDIAEDIFESLGDETLVHCKEAIRSISSFMEEAPNSGRELSESTWTTKIFFVHISRKAGKF